MRTVHHSDVGRTGTHGHTGTRNSTPRRLREDLRTTRGDTERTAATLVLTNQGAARFTWFQSVSRSALLPRLGG